MPRQPRDTAIGADFRRQREEAKIHRRTIAKHFGFALSRINGLERGKFPWTYAECQTYQAAMGLYGASAKLSPEIEAIWKQYPEPTARDLI
jgi:hypothetical protein